MNYDLDPHGRVVVPPPDGFQSSNWFAELDSDFRITRLDPIDDSAVGVDRQRWNRLEDCRLFRWKDAWWFTATWVLQDGPLLCQIALCRLEGSKVVEWHLLPSPAGASKEKNWMPRVDDDRLQWIYWIDPLQVLTYRDGEISLRRLGRCGRLENWAGSSPLIRYRDHWLGVIHLRRDWRYASFFEHRLVELNDDFEIRRMSPAFTLEGANVEYCAGLCVTDSHAILSYGVQDREARIMRLDLSTMEAVLRPLGIPQWFSVLTADVRRGTRPWMRQPGKKLRAIAARLRGGLTVLGTFGLGDLVMAVASNADLTMKLTRQCIRLAA